MQSIQNLSLLRWGGRGYFPMSHLSPENSWPCPRWPLASPGHKSCNPARTVRGLSRNFSFFRSQDISNATFVHAVIVSTSLLSCEVHCDSVEQGHSQYKSWKGWQTLQTLPTFLFIELSRGATHEPTSVANVSQMKYQTTSIKMLYWFISKRTWNRYCFKGNDFGWPSRRARDLYYSYCFSY